MMLPTYSLADFINLMKSDFKFPFFSVLLYAPLNGLNDRLHKYVLDHWAYLNSLTGDSCLLLAVEDIKRNDKARDYRPTEIYDIARQLGAPVNTLPCMIFFTEPKDQQATMLFQLRKFLPDSKTLTDDDLTALFSDVAAVADQCHAAPAAERLQCLREGFAKNWPQASRWAGAAGKAGDVAVPANASEPTIAQALDKILPILQGMLHTE
jgi:hypothetical protein